MPSAGPVDVLDVGCGTGSLSLLLAEPGHAVTGVDLAPGMPARARPKLGAHGLPATFVTGDAMEPPTGDHRFGAVVSRHLIRTLPWNGGVSATELAAVLRPLVTDLRVEPLGDRPELWGGPVTDERYAVVADA